MNQNVVSRLLTFFAKAAPIGLEVIPDDFLSFIFYFLFFFPFNEEETEKTKMSCCHFSVSVAP